MLRLLRTTLFPGLCAHLFKYASQRSVQFFPTKIRVRILLFGHVMHNHLLGKHEFVTFDIECQFFVHVLLKCLK